MYLIIQVAISKHLENCDLGFFFITVGKIREYIMSDNHVYNYIRIPT